MKVGIIFGGKSVEHDVSIITGLQIIENINKDKYEPIPIYITKEGKWLTGKSLLDYETFKNKDFSKTEEVFLSPISGERNLYANPNKRGIFTSKILGQVDLIFPALHGTYGEDGSIQGLLEMMDIPYVGSKVLASSLAMDKVLAKNFYKANGLPIVDYYWFYRSAWTKNKRMLPLDIEKELFYPMFVKPANLGSSVGISKVYNREDLIKAIDVAIKYDKKIIIEQAIENPREINCSLIGYEGEIKVSQLEEAIHWEDFLTFEDKYIRENIKGGQLSDDSKGLPAKISDKLRIKIELLAKRAFEALSCSGIARVHFILDEMHNIHISEINTMPGSLSFHLWRGLGYSFEDIIEELIEIAMIDYREKQNNIYSYDVDLLNEIDYSSEESVK